MMNKQGEINNAKDNNITHTHTHTHTYTDAWGNNTKSEL